MFTKILKTTVMSVLLASILPFLAKADNTQDYSQYYDRVKIDRYLDVQVWPNHSDGDYFIGDNIVINFRTNRDAFVAIYSVDSKGRVDLLFPSDPDEDNFIKGGVTHRLPNGNDDFDLVVSGPEGVENIQIIASRERFPIPDWYPASGLQVGDDQDRLDFMDYVNSRYFVRYDGQRFAYDRSAININEWEQDYYRPVYYPDYPDWTIRGNVYIDYPYGGTVYINGIYWGVAPLYIPSIYVGWQTFTIYDPYGYCWESDVYISRYNTVVLGRTVIQTSPRVVSKYKKVRMAGYRNPLKNGYPHFKTKRMVTKSSRTYVSGKTRAGKSATITYKKKYVYGSTKLVKTSRGYETKGVFSRDKRSKRSGYEYSKSYRLSKSSGNRVEKRGERVSSKAGYKSLDRYGLSGKSKRNSAFKKRSNKEKSYKSSVYRKKSGTQINKKSVKKSSKGHKRSKTVEKHDRSSKGKSSKGKAYKNSPKKSGERHINRKSSGGNKSSGRTIRSSKRVSSGHRYTGNTKIRSKRH
ncbi:MAG: DUF4384 domain-containing protein [FCB group bacterium]|nr:DUF4384 domain-containing protein [FCB group bacterium]